MKILIDDTKIIELIRYILQNDYDIYNITEIEEKEKLILERFETEKTIEFIYQYISEIIRDMEDPSA